MADYYQLKISDPSIKIEQIEMMLRQACKERGIEYPFEINPEAHTEPIDANSVAEAEKVKKNTE